MAKWSRAQIELMARAAGWGARSRDASHVAMAESSGDDKIVNSIGCVGLMQINQPVHIKDHPRWTVKWLQDPINNLRAAKVLYDQSGWVPWEDSRTKGGGGGWGDKVSGGGGASQVIGDPLEDFWNDLLGEPERGPGSPGWEGPDFSPDLGLGELGEVATQLGRLAQATAKAANWLSDPENWVRVAYVTGGAVLALVAVSSIVKPYTAGAVKKIAPPVRAAARTVRS